MTKRFILIIVLISFSQSAFGDHLIKVDKALRKIYKKATRFEEGYINLDEQQIRQIEADVKINFAGSHSNQVVMYKSFAGNTLIGYAYEDTVIGKWGPIHYLAGLDLEGAVVNVVVLDYDEIRGKPIAKRRFLKQYRGKSIRNPLKLRKDIDGVTGATISSRSLTDGIRKIVYIHSLVVQ